LQTLVGEGGDVPQLFGHQGRGSGRLAGESIRFAQDVGTGAQGLGVFDDVERSAWRCRWIEQMRIELCLLYTSDAADDM
jgi:hypothetical protein